MVSEESFPRTPGIYAIWWIAKDGKELGVYIGSAISLKIRRRNHLSSLRKGCHHTRRLQRTWNKYGQDSFRFELLEHVENKSDLISREQFWIDSIIVELGRNFLFNECLVAGSCLGTKQSPETIAKRVAKVSVSLKGRRPSDAAIEASRSAESRAKKSAKLKGRRPSDATMAASRAAAIGRRHTDAARAKMSITRKGRRHSDSAIAAMRAAATGRHPDATTRAKLSVAKKGRPLPLGHRKKIGDAQPVGVSGMRGIRKTKDGKWRATAPGQVHLGTFGTMEEAVAAYQDEVEMREAAYKIASNLNIGLHEAIHAVIWRALGEDIVEVVNQDDRACTTISMTRPLDLWDVIAVMAPEVYMTMHGIPFTEHSVSDDRRSVDIILEGEDNAAATRESMRLELMQAFACPHIIQAIEVLAPILDEIENVGSIPGDRIHELIDPILTPSKYALGLRELLKERHATNS